MTGPFVHLVALFIIQLLTKTWELRHIFSFLLRFRLILWRPFSSVLQGSNVVFNRQDLFDGINDVDQG